MIKAKYFVALFVFFNLLTFTSCTADDADEIQLSKTVQDSYAEGEDEAPKPIKGT